MGLSSVIETAGPAASSTLVRAQDRLTLNVERRPDLPPLAWALKHVRGAPVVRILAGDDVREGDGIVWEGVNPCTSDPRHVTQHHFPLCTGALIEAGAMIAFTPGHTLDRLFLAQRGDALYVSNSLPFVLVLSGLELQPKRLNYHWHLGAIGTYAKEIPAVGGKLFAYANTKVAIGIDHDIALQQHPLSPEFKDYAEYRAALDAFISEAAAAASHPVNIGYKPITTISTGYDSTAASVLARQAGADTALTVSDSRAGPSDSGADIAGRLGLRVEAISRTDHQRFGVDAERLFYFAAVGNDIIFYPWRQRLHRTLLFTGYKGDMLWDRSFVRALGTWSYDADGATMQEFRLRSGFVHLPPAYFGCRRADTLLAISKSAEMAPWTLCNSYDRPIPRRIVEDAGIPRDWFGQAKKMVTSTIGVDKDRYIKLADLGLSAEFTSALAAHARRAAGLESTASFAFNTGMHLLLRSAHRVAFELRRALSRPRRADSVGTKRGPSLKDRIFFELENRFPERRMYMTPFTQLNYAAQVANAMLARDYPES